MQFTDAITVAGTRRRGYGSLPMLGCAVYADSEVGKDMMRSFN
jgi:hypothetical protein